LGIREAEPPEKKGGVGEQPVRHILREGKGILKKKRDGTTGRGYGKAIWDAAVARAKNDDLRKIQFHWKKERKRRRPISEKQGD